MRERLPDQRKSITHKLVLQYGRTPKQMERLHIYITVGTFDDGRPGELFVTVNKGNDIIAGWAKCWSIAISLCLQSGVTVEKLYEKFSHQSFPPDGFTENKDIHSCASIVDYVMSFLKQQFINPHQEVV